MTTGLPNSNTFSSGGNPSIVPPAGPTLSLALLDQNFANCAPLLTNLTYYAAGSTPAAAVGLIAVQNGAAMTDLSNTSTGAFANLVSDLPSGVTPLAGTELVTIIQAGAAVKVPTSAIGTGGGGGGGTAFFTRTAYTATSGQTTFGATYTPGQLEVYNNGTLVPAPAYTATNGYNVVFSGGLTAGDYLEIIAYNTSTSVVTPSPTFTRTTYTATSGQTIFSAAYNVGFVEVFQNGVLQETTSYTATDGATVVLKTGATANDLIDIIAFGTLNIANVANANFSNVTGTLGLANGGTGATTATAALTALQYLSGATGAAARTAPSKLADVMSVWDFAGTSPPASGADWTSIINTADTAATAAGKALYFPAYTYGISNTTVTRNGCDWIGEDPQSTIIKALAQSFSTGTNYGSVVAMANSNNSRTIGLTFDISAGIFSTPSVAVVTASITAGQTGAGYISGATAPVMTVTAVTSGSLAVGQPISGAGVATGQFILSLGTGAGGTGTYNLGIAQGSPISSETITATGTPGNVYAALQFVNCSNWTVENCRFTGIQQQTIGLAVDEGNNWAIRRCYFNMPSPSNRYNQAINVSNALGPDTGYEISGCTCIGTGIFSNGSGGIITNNYISGTYFGGGIAIGPNVGALLTIISDNYCAAGTGLDINTTFPSGIECWAAYTSITGNVCYSNSGHGISLGAPYISCGNNFCLNNGQLNGSGITLYSIPSYAAQHCAVTGNVCTDSQGSPTQQYGIAEYNVSGSGVLDNVFSGNVLDGNKTGTTNLLGANSDGFIGPVLSSPVTAATPGTITSGSSYQLGSIFVRGAALGDIVSPSYSQDLKGCLLTAYVSATNTIQYTFYNGTGSSQSLTAGNLQAMITKRPGYTGLS